MRRQIRPQRRGVTGFRTIRPDGIEIPLILILINYQHLAQRPQVRFALHRIRLRASPSQGGHEQRNQNTNDADDHQQLHKREANAGFRGMLDSIFHGRTNDGVCL